MFQSLAQGQTIGSACYFPSKSGYSERSAYFETSKKSWYWIDWREMQHVLFILSNVRAIILGFKHAKNSGVTTIQPTLQPEDAKGKGGLYLSMLYNSPSPLLPLSINHAQQMSMQVSCPLLGVMKRDNLKLPGFFVFCRNRKFKISRKSNVT